MSSPYTIHAARMGEKKKIVCANATETVRQRDALLRTGWGVSLADGNGMPMTDWRIEGVAAFEAEQDAAKPD